MTKIYKIGLVILVLIITQQAFPQKENSKSPLTGEQQIEVSEGFSFVSSRLISENPDMEEVVQEILNDDLQYIRNSNGAMLTKIGPNWVNGIGDWIVFEGYLIKTNVAGQFTIEGIPIPQNTPNNLFSGFQFVTYLPVDTINAAVAFNSVIGDNLSFVRNSDGKMLRKIGPRWVNGIGDCTPGEGFLVKMHAEDVLVYPIIYGDPCPEISTITYEGQVYNTVLIGNQCWLKENLNVGTMINANIDMNDDGIIEKYCFMNDSTMCNEYGGLYQWNEIMEYSTIPGVQGICPASWHIPTNGEWTILFDFLGGSSVAGGEMKEFGTAHWFSPNTGATNESGFTAIPGGCRNSMGNFMDYRHKGHFWSSSEFSSTSAWSWFLYYFNDDITPSNNYNRFGFSVRCLQD